LGNGFEATTPFAGRVKRLEAAVLHRKLVVILRISGCKIDTIISLLSVFPKYADQY
jgi:hypothetical protein